MSTAAASRLDQRLAAVAVATETMLDRLLPPPEGLQARIQDAARYAVFAGGKRLRPFLVCEGAALFGVPEERALRVAAAVEAFHTYSLVHDDLPCMDDDDLRRGKPTVHVQYDEATAVLAGDALLTWAFEVLSDPATHPAASVRADLVLGLARAGGTLGMIGGQAIDMAAPDLDLDADGVILLQRLKTGALFEFSCIAGAILAEAGPDAVAALTAYGRDFGLAFQIADDLIDHAGDSSVAGKTVGKDAAQGKATLVSLWGPDAAREKALAVADRAVGHLARFGGASDMLSALVARIVDRTS